MTFGSLEGSKQSISFSQVIQNAQVKGNRLSVIGEASSNPVSLYPWKWGGLRKNTGQAVSQSVSQGEVGVITTGGQSGIQGALAHPALGAGS